MVASSHTALPSDLPNFFPVASVMIGLVNTFTVTPRTLRIRSMPEVRLPHWSDPPISSVQPYSSNR